MTRPHPSAAEADQPTLVEFELTPWEVVELWSFVHGDIMEPGIRQLLRAYLGLCPRHTWGYAATEIELWQDGAGPRGGHQPFDVTVLYDDLLEHTAGQLRRPAGLFHHPRQALTPHGQCRICEQTLPRPDDAAVLPVGYAGANGAELAAETNRLTHTIAWCQQTRPQWRNRVCPACATTANQTLQQPTPVQTPNCARLCRQHLLAIPSLTTDCARQAAARLDHIDQRLRRLTTSMTQDGPAASAADDASWIEALGWFAGWQVPLTLARRERAHLMQQRDRPGG